MKRYLMAVVVAGLLAGIWWGWQDVGGRDQRLQQVGSDSGDTQAAVLEGGSTSQQWVDDDGRAVADSRGQQEAPALDPMQAQLSQIADAYRESMRFPAYSKPLTENDWQMLNPRAFVPTETPIEGQPDLRVSVEFSQAINDVRLPLPVRVVVVSGTAKAASVTVSLNNAGRTTAAMPLQAPPSPSGIQTFEGVLPPEMLAGAGPGEVVLKADLRLFSGDTVSAAAIVELYASAADLTYLGDAYVDGADLVIPAHFDVFNRGHFRLQGNLMDAATGAPVSHVNASFVLSEEAPMGLLKVHAETLRAMQAPGPYVLTDFNIRRSQSWPGDSDGYGSALQASYPVAGFSLDSYSNEPYVDEQAQQRMEFLDRITEEGGLP